MQSRPLGVVIPAVVLAAKVTSDSASNKDTDPPSRCPVSVTTAAAASDVINACSMVMGITSVIIGLSIASTNHIIIAAIIVHGKVPASA